MENSDQTGSERKVRVHVKPDLEYAYRDVINIFVGNGDVLLEFGNAHRSLPDRHVTIADRIVISVPNAYDFLQRLNQTLQEAQARLQEQIKSREPRGDNTDQERT